MPVYGLDFALPFTGDPDATLPWADDDDALLVPGSIVLVEPAHSSNPIVGIPAAGQTIPNIAYKRFQDLYGAAIFTGKVDNGSGAAGNIVTVTAIAAGQIVPGMQMSIGGAIGYQLTSTESDGSLGKRGTYNFLGAAALTTSQTITATAPTQANCALSLVEAGTQTNVFQRERTTLGGLHMMASQVNNTVNGQAQYIWADYNASPVGSYLVANKRHAFYFSVWEKITRVALANPSPPQHSLNALSTSNFNFIMVGGIGTNYEYPIPSQSNFVGVYDSADPNTLGNNVMRAYGVNGFLGSLSDTSLTNQGFFANVMGCAPGGWAAATNYGNKSASRVLYRAYLEDLTVSGRTYAQVLAADQTLYAAAFAAGGRYYNDSVPSVPATVLP